jgi:hypothetical protein
MWSGKWYGLTLTKVEEQWVSVTPLRQFVQIRLNFQTVLESTEKQKELHVISVEENLRYSVDKPDEAKWSQMISLWNTRCHLDILRNCVTDSYFLDSPRQIRSQPHASYPQTSHSATVAMRCWSHGLLQSSIQNVKKGAFWIFLYGMSQGTFDPLQRPFDPSLLLIKKPLKNPYRWNQPDNRPQLNSARKMRTPIGSLSSIGSSWSHLDW